MSSSAQPTISHEKDARTSAIRAGNNVVRRSLTISKSKPAGGIKVEQKHQLIDSQNVSVNNVQILNQSEEGLARFLSAPASRKHQSKN